LGEAEEYGAVNVVDRGKGGGGQGEGAKKGRGEGEGWEGIRASGGEGEQGLGVEEGEGGGWREQYEKERGRRVTGKGGRDEGVEEVRAR